MGLAKYMEDNIEIFNNRMYKKGIDILELNDFKKAQNEKVVLIPPEEEYLLVLKELRKIEMWLNIIDKAEKVTRTKAVCQIMEKQKKQLNKVKGGYTDYKFDFKFKHLRSERFNISNKELKQHENEIIKSYIRCFLDNLRPMKNVTHDDAIKINFLYIDIEKFAKEFLDIDTKKSQLPLIQNIRENILKDDEKLLILCTHCNRKTYIDFNTCIHCKYPIDIK